MFKVILLLLFIVGLVSSIFKGDKDETIANESPQQYNARIDAERASNTGSQRINKSGDIHGAWAYTQLYVETQLKNPNSADFPFGGSSDVTYIGDNLYSFNSYVDSKNAFGAEVRVYFSGTIRQTSGGWTVESFLIK